MSWINIKIKNESFIYKCVSNEKNEITIHLSDLKKLWSEFGNNKKILERAREQNKRIQLSDDVILQTIKEIPYNIDIVKSPISDEKTLVLLVKYYLSNRPFTFQWNLNLCSQDEFYNLLTKPLLLSVKCFTEKNRVLKDVIKKKDIEIQQYKIEGAILKRNKVATNEFNENEFEAEYPNTIAGELLEYVDEKYSNWKESCDKSFSPSTSGKSGTGNKFNESSPNKNNTQKGNNAKNLMLQKRQQLAKLYQIQNRERNVNYMDSDISLTPTPPEKQKKPQPKEPEQGDDDDILSIAKSLEELERQRKADMELASPKPKPKRKKFNL